MKLKNILPASWFSKILLLQVLSGGYMEDVEIQLEQN